MWAKINVYFHDKYEKQVSVMDCRYSIVLLMIIINEEILIEGERKSPSYRLFERDLILDGGTEFK